MKVKTCRFFALTHETTLPLKHGSLALSSEISSFTTLKNNTKQNHERSCLGGKYYRAVISQQRLWCLDSTDKLRKSNSR